MRHAARSWMWSLLLAAMAIAGATRAETAASGSATAQSPPATPSEDIRDIRGPKAVHTTWWLPALVAGVVVIAVGAYAIRYRRHRKTSLRPLTLAERALEDLEATRALMQPARAREFGIAASEIIRDYIQKRFNVVATQQTTEEFLQALLQNPHESLASHRSLLEQFLQQCDFVKFAGASLEIADMESLFQSARGFVLQTAEARPT